MEKIKAKMISFIYDYIYIPFLFNLVYFRDLRKIRIIYGDFECLSRKDQKKYTLHFSNESKNVAGLLVSEIVKPILKLKLNPQVILLDGDDRSIGDQVKNIFHFENSQVVTAGIDGNYDYEWNFEEDCPENMPKEFDLIISQAIFEHLIDPFKHFRDLTKLLKRGGYLAIHTHIPGYPYHRYPIDAVRFFPDWFENSAQKTGLTVKRRYLRNFHIIYLFQK